MRVHFGSSMGMDVEQYTLEVIHGNQRQEHMLQTLPIMAMQQFQSLVMQAARSPKPCKIKIAKEVEFWSEIDKKFRSRVNSIEFKNIAFGDKDW